MPELPEVEVFEQVANGAALNRRVCHVRILDASLLQGASPRRFCTLVNGRRIVASRRHGKLLGIELDRGT